MKPAILILKKEVLEMLRDKRVVYNAVFGPLFIIVLMVFALGFVMETVKKDVPSKVHVIYEGELPAYIQSPDGEKGPEIIRVPDVETAQKLVEDGKADVVLEIVPLSTTELTPYHQQIINAYFDPDRERSGVILSQLQRGIQEQNDKAVKQLLASKGVPEQMAEPVKLERKPIERQKGLGGFIAGFLPYIIVLWAFYGAFGSASEMVAGEKEKNTLETLLISPVERSQIALGKFYSLMLLSIVSMLSAFAGIVLVGVLKVKGTQEMFPDGLTITFASAVSSVLVMIPLAAMLAGILLAVSTRARNTRDCQTQLSLVSFVILMPAVFSQFIGLTSYAQARWVNFVPILNSATTLKAALLNKVDWTAIAITVAISLVLAWASMSWSVRLFKREEVLAKI
ncbi:MAG: ABC transporter permease [Fimbriimonadaceae bacterium]|nr:ABC transporter permease [Fimbriimonadaceae bacterium]